MVADILRETYEEFQLPERNFLIAREDVGKSYDTLYLIEKEKTEKGLER